MTAYRCYLLGEDGKIRISKVIESPTDTAALQEAERRLVNSGFPAAEIWDRDRRIGIIELSKARPNKGQRQTEAL